MKFDLLNSSTDGNGLRKTDQYTTPDVRTSDIYNNSNRSRDSNNYAPSGCSCNNKPPLSDAPNTMLQSISNYYNQYFASGNADLLRK